MARLRVEKVQEAIKNELSKMILFDAKDPRIKCVTVTGVELTDDMSYATIFVSMYGKEEEQEAAWKGLNKALGYMRSEIAKRIRLRFAPQLILKKDTSMEYSAHIETILNKIKAEDAARGPKEVNADEQEA
ncbi:MAG: 30S ribosome-binding factor RbfA [Phascolarctobacterium sp.]|nr:30S ribosome-binding factor RbfA [Phascolarctobacterium sp.]